MDGVILEFAACCRANAMRVSTAEVLDCLAQLDVISPLDEKTFHTVLKTNFSKSIREQTEFERLYRLFFKEMKAGLMAADPAEAVILDPEDAKETRQERELLDRFMAQALAGEEASDLDGDLAAFMSGNPKLFIERVRGIHDQESVATQAVKSNLGQLTGRLEIMLAVDRMRKRVARFSGGLDARVDGAKMTSSRLAALAGQRLDRAMTFLNEDPKPDNAGLRTGGDGAQYFAGVGDIPFSNLTLDEMARVTEITDQWVKKLKEITTLRFAAARKGGVDVKKDYPPVRPVSRGARGNRAAVPSPAQGENRHPLRYLRIGLVHGPVHAGHPLRPAKLLCPGQKLCLHRPPHQYEPRVRGP